MEILIIYWIASTIYGVYWISKKLGQLENKEYYTLLDLIAYLLASMIITPFALLIYLFNSIKFKRPK
jgi:hypothetical protein